jgi:hypothetical protein
MSERSLLHSGLRHPVLCRALQPGRLALHPRMWCAALCCAVLCSSHAFAMAPDQQRPSAF